MDVDLARLPFPAPGGDEKSHEDRGNPLEEHQPAKQPVRVPNNLLPMLLKEFLGALDGIVDATGAKAHFKHSTGGFVSERFAREQPKTRVRIRAGVSRLTSATSARSPALSPACTLEAVIPPLKSWRPSTSSKRV